MPIPLSEVAGLRADKIVGCSGCGPEDIRSDSPVLIMLAAGRGTRFGAQPKCVQPILGKPLARHTLDAFRQLSATPSICLVGYMPDVVADGLGSGNIFVRSDDPAGGTALAAMEAFSVDKLAQENPIVVVTMGDRVVPKRIFERLLETHRAGSEATLTMLTAVYEPPKNRGKGRIVRDLAGNGASPKSDASGTIVRIVEQPDIDLIESDQRRHQLDAQTEGNCPLYVIRAATLKQYLGNVTPDNAQGQYYFTDIVEAIHRDGGTIRSVTLESDQPEFPVLCADVTRADDLPKLECVLTQYQSHLAAGAIITGRSAGQALSIAAQLEELTAVGRLEELGFDPSQPIGIGVSGGRLRIAFMHPDMGRFFGPAWQMPIGAADESGREQIVVMIQASSDDLIHLYPTEKVFREAINTISSEMDCMYPPEDVVDGYSYENFGTAMTEQLLTKLGYYSDEQIAKMRRSGQALPDTRRWVSNAMRRPFALLGNVIASFRTVREGAIGGAVQAALGQEGFRGLRVASTGEIPQGGFSSSSAVTVAVINAIDALFDFQLACDQKVELACQSEYGTGVRAGALDQATEQKGCYRVGALISSNPKENYRIIGTHDVPADRFRVLFPYTVDRDSQAWKWSAGVYAASAGEDRLTAVEMRKMTGKASELAAILTRLPVNVDFFQEIEQELVETGELPLSTTMHVRDTLRRIPLRVTQAELRDLLEDHLDWYVEQQQRLDGITRQNAERMFQSLLSGWHDPLLNRTMADGEVVVEQGAPLRAMVAYLYAEVAHNCYLIHHPLRWIECVTRSQRGDRCFDIDIDTLPSKKEMLRDFAWEQGASGAERMRVWLDRCDATPFDFNRGLGDLDLSEDGWRLTQVKGTNFFRGLALIDLAEAMLKRAFGASAIAARVNGAGQGDYFQVHVDTQQADVEEVKNFIRKAIYRRFGLRPAQDFVEPNPGGGAVGLRLGRYADLRNLVQQLREQAHQAEWQPLASEGRGTRQVRA